MRVWLSLVAGISGAVAIIAACNDTPPAASPARPVADAAVVDASPSDASACAPSKLAAPARPLHILMLTKEALYNHAAAHAVGDKALADALRAKGHDVTVTASTDAFTDQGLAPFDVVVFFVTSGEVFADAGVPEADARAAFQRFLERGGGLAGMHTFTATEYTWPFMRQYVGGAFLGHGMGDAQVTEAHVIVDDASALTAMFPSPWVHSDEWYYYLENPQKNPELHMLAWVDETTLPPEYPDAGRYAPDPHPIAWARENTCGRMFTTTLGHTGEAYQDPVFIQHLVTGIEWAGAPFTAPR